MSRIDRSTLLQFLQEPRFAHEVAGHFGISETLARHELLEAIEAGQVLTSKNPPFQTWKSSKGKRKRIRRTIYVSRKNPMLFDSGKKFRLRTANGMFSKLKSSPFSIRFRSLKPCMIAKDIVNQKLAIFAGAASENKADLAEARSSYKTIVALASEFDLPTAKANLASHKTHDQILGGQPAMSQRRVNSLSQVERIRLFQTLLERPTAFFDLHARFGVSRQIVKGLVKNGLIAETWESKGIGVKFKLTKKGEVYLKELEAAAKFEPSLAKKAFVRLKQKAFF
jgi:hypothetical protein